MKAHELCNINFISDVPSAPQNLRGTEVDASFITLVWDIPATDGGSAVTGYVIEKKDVKRADYVFLANVDATTLQYKATKLFEGSEYLFRVFAENQAGLSKPCELDKPIKARMPYGQITRLGDRLNLVFFSDASVSSETFKCLLF